MNGVWKKEDKVRQEILSQKREAKRLQKENMALYTWVEDNLGTPRTNWIAGPYSTIRRVQMQKEADFNSDTLLWLEVDSKVEVQEVEDFGGLLRGKIPGGWITLRNKNLMFQYVRWTGVRMDDSEPKNHLERCSEEQCRSMERLLSESGSGTKVLAAYYNDNPDMRFRYEEVKKKMIAGSGSIKKEDSHLAKIVNGDKGTFDNLLGEYEPSINEFPLWHGTPSAEAVKGIAENGMDINFFKVGVYGTGFYFSDVASTSLGYCGGTHRISPAYPAVRVMFLCRVVVGTTRQTDSISANDEATRDRLFAESKGPGGVFGPASAFHTLKSMHYICMASSQIYPEYIMLLS